MLAAIGLSAVAAVILGFNFVESGLAWGASFVLVLLALGVYASSKGTLLSSLALAFIQSCFVALHIDLARGMTEFHFGVFVTLARCWSTRTGAPSSCRRPLSPSTTWSSTACRRRASACIA